MAQKRMFSHEIVSSEDFYEMPGSSQALYLHLVMNADDDGFVDPRRIMRLVKAAEDDLKILIGKRFVILFKSGITVIKHWRMHNSIRKDWYRPTKYLEEKEQLFLKDNNSYTLDKYQGIPLILDSRHQIGTESVPQVQVKIKVKSKVKKNINDTNVSVSTSDTNAPKEKELVLMSQSEAVEWMRSNHRRDIKIIAEWADEMKPEYETKEQWNEFLHRNLKAAKILKAFTDKQLSDGMRAIKNAEYITKPTLETLVKFVIK